MALGQNFDPDNIARILVISPQSATPLRASRRFVDHLDGIGRAQAKLRLGPREGHSRDQHRDDGSCSPITQHEISIYGNSIDWVTREADGRLA